MKFRADIVVKLKENVKDSKGEAVLEVINRIKLAKCQNARLGKFFTLEIEAKNKEEALQNLENICSKVLSNPVTEVFEILKFEEIG